RPDGGKSGWARFALDGRLVVTTGAGDAVGHAVSVWEPDGKPVTVLRGHRAIENEPLRQALQGGLRDAHFSPDGARLVAVHGDRNPRLTRPGDGGKVVEPQPSPRFTPVRLWDVRSGKEVLALQGFSRSVATAEFSPDGRRLLTYSDGFDGYALLTEKDEPWGSGGGGQGKSQVHVWDAATGERLRTLLPEGTPYCSGAAWLRDGRRIVTVGNGPKGASQVWDAAGGKLLVTCERGPGAVDQVVASPDGRWLLGRRYTHVDDRDRLLLWDAASGRLHRTLEAHRGEVTWAGFGPDGRLLTTGTDALARVWDAEAGRELLRLGGHEREVLTAAF